MRHCKNCNTPLLPRQRTFCRRACQHENQYNEYIARWQQGKENGMRGHLSISAHVRNYLLKKYEYKCSLCGWNKKNPVTNKVPLEVEHINGDHTDNTEENLTILCPNCHSLTPTFRNLNMGKGRKNRK